MRMLNEVELTVVAGGSGVDTDEDNGNGNGGDDSNPDGNNEATTQAEQGLSGLDYSITTTTTTSWTVRWFHPAFGAGEAKGKTTTTTTRREKGGDD